MQWVFSDEDSAASVLREMPGEMVRKGKEEGVIVVDLVDNLKEKYRIRTRIVSQEAFEKVFQEVYQRVGGSFKRMKQENFPWLSIFTSGYGSGLRTLGNEDYQYYVAIDALYSLFKYDAALQNPELSIRRAIAMAQESSGKKGSIKMEKYLLQLLKDILNLGPNDLVILTSTSIEVKSEEWGQSELSTLGDGYVATITWILDLFSWWMLYIKGHEKDILEYKEITGIVLVDQIEEHLHPIWQVKIMNLLRESFPKVQFITTTHSPLVITSKLNMNVQIIKLGKSQKKTVNGWLAEDIYREIMGLESSRSSQIKNLIDTYKELHLNQFNSKSSKKELEKMAAIRHELSITLPPNDPIIESLELKNMSEFLKKG